MDQIVHHFRFELDSQALPVEPPLVIGEVVGFDWWAGVGQTWVIRNAQDRPLLIWANLQHLPEIGGEPGLAPPGEFLAPLQISLDANACPMICHDSECDPGFLPPACACDQRLGVRVHAPPAEPLVITHSNAALLPAELPGRVLVLEATAQGGVRRGPKLP